MGDYSLFPKDLIDILVSFLTSAGEILTLSMTCKRFASVIKEEKSRYAKQFIRKVARLHCSQRILNGDVLVVFSVIHLTPSRVLHGEYHEYLIAVDSTDPLHRIYKHCRHQLCGKEFDLEKGEGCDLLKHPSKILQVECDYYFGQKHNKETRILYSHSDPVLLQRMNRQHQLHRQQQAQAQLQQQEDKELTDAKTETKEAEADKPIEFPRDAYVKQVTYFQFGKEHGERVTYKSGIKIKVETFSHAKKEGMEKNWWTGTKNLSSECNYKEDRKDGAEIFYYPDGKMKRRCYWKRGFQDDIEEGFYGDEKSTLSYQYHIKNGIREGISREFYPDGKESYYCGYVCGQKEGEERTWMEDKQVYRVTTYANGKETRKNPIYRFFQGKKWKDPSVTLPARSNEVASVGILAFFPSM